jgi:hypothetical protein
VVWVAWYLSALCAEDNQALGALMVEIHRSGRAMKVLAAMAVQALDFAHPVRCLSCDTRRPLRPGLEQYDGIEYAGLPVKPAY